MSADTAALFVARQIIAVHRVGHGIHGTHQLRGDLGGQELLEVEEGALLPKFAAQRLGVDGRQSRSERVSRGNIYRATPLAVERRDRCNNLRYSNSDHKAYSGAQIAANTNMAD
jgi:hypothetical protein